jgi:thioredoxin-related protein
MMDDKYQLDLFQRLSCLEAIMKEQCKKIDSLHAMLLQNQQLYLEDVKTHTTNMHACRERASEHFNSVYATIEAKNQFAQQLINEEKKRTNDLMLKVVFFIVGSVVFSISLAVLAQKYF